MIRSVVRGVGAYLPSRIVTNEELSRTLDTSDAWIRERTGIAQRRVAAPGELTSDLATAAARDAIARADVDPATIDLVLLATATPDHTFPATATAVQRKLGLPPGIAFDLQAVCAGFTYALATADSYLKTGLASRALVIGAETFSRLLDWEDRGTAILFGDGAGAVILDAIEDGGAPAPSGILASVLVADGRHYDDLYVDGGPSATGTTGHVRMNGREVFRQAVARLAEVAQLACARAGLSLDEIDLMVPHQANARIIDAVGRKLGFPPDRVMLTVDRHANTSAASIPLALAEADAAGRLGPGRVVLMNALGGGLTWGAVVARF